MGHAPPSTASLARFFHRLLAGRELSLEDCSPEWKELSVSLE